MSSQYVSSNRGSLILVKSQNPENPDSDKEQKLYTPVLGTKIKNLTILTTFSYNILSKTRGVAQPG